eukprot:TRINITY_DN3386_c3_g1_i2.p1 TRINITY_DN3386_c3_g1~~TRINITY_DN3386_c3_g1_i2.p1  ORF type:complete len:343 (+),score=62.25 TRINITY_DN3386_c3_g1_i2:24-1031(+)
MQFLRKVDSFRTIPKDLSEGTATGAVMTLVAMFLCGVLFMCELVAFMTVTSYTKIVMDSNQDKQLKINFDVTLSDLACDHLTVGVWDGFGTDRLNITKNIRRQQIDHLGQDKGHAYTDDELLELDSTEQELTASEKAEYDADWSSSSDHFKHENFDAVIESHDFTMVLFYADWCPPCRAFKPVWNMFESDINGNAGSKIVDADQRPLGQGVRVLKLNCVDFKQACIDESIQSFPAVRLYRRSLGASKKYAAYEGERSVDGLFAFLKEQAAKRHLHVGAKHHSMFTEGCRIKGFVEVARVPGTLHIESKSTDEKMLNSAFTNTTQCSQKGAGSKDS